MIKLGSGIGVIFIVLMIVVLCFPKDKNTFLSSQAFNKKALFDSTSINITKNVTVENYFTFIDSVVREYNTKTTYPLTEHLLVRANPWIIDTLQNTDYYRMIAKDSFVYNQKKMIVLPKNASIIIPDSLTAKKILNSFKKTLIDVNIPEFKLRIYEGSTKLFEFPVRVGRNEKKYLEMSGRIQDLKTKTGKGKIVGYNLNPGYVNPANNHEYFVTKIGDNRVTKLPQIPFIETEINGLRYGQLIHPTTNPKTLGKAYSNGCIGTNEGDAWIIYYYAPINTKINIRYNLNVIDKKGGNLVLKDVYKRK